MSGKTRLCPPWTIGLPLSSSLIESTPQPTAIEAASQEPSGEARQQAAQEKVRRCDDRLVEYRAALDAGVDPTVVGKWVAEVQLERRRAELELLRSEGPGRMTKAEGKELVDQLAGIVVTLRAADPTDRAEVNAQLGLRLTYQPDRRLVTAEMTPPVPCTKRRVRGGT